VRVPLVVYDSAGPVSLTKPVAGTAVFELVARGRLPDAPQDVVSYAFPDVMWDKVYGRGGRTQVGVVGVGEKLLWEEGAVQRFDLRADPLALQAQAAPDPQHPLWPTMLRALEQVEGARTEGSGVDAEMAERLKQIGYVE
jgi:hypothetical protein